MTVATSESGTSLTSKEISRLKQGLPPWESMSFACGGWLQFYMYGVGKALQASKMDKGVRYYGCSAGSLTAMGLVYNGSFDECIKFIRDECLEEAYTVKGGLFKLHSYVRTYTERLLETNFRPIDPGVLNIAITKLPYFQAVRVSEFKTPEDVIFAILSSCAAFPFAAIVHHNGEWYLDGGASDFQPVEDDETITVSPLYFSDCDIKPSRYVPLWWSFLPPRSKDTVDWLYRLGWDDCITYLTSRGIDVELQFSTNFEDVTVKHPYDVEGNVCLDRFMGYEVKSIAHEWVGFLFDMILLGVLIIFVRPGALLSIYIELLAKISALLVLAVVHFMIDIHPSILKDMVIHPYQAFMRLFLKENHAKSGLKVRTVAVKELWECTACVWSLSLLMRLISGPPSPKVLKKHKMLSRHSVVYRFCRHIL